MKREKVLYKVILHGILILDRFSRWEGRRDMLLHRSLKLPVKALLLMEHKRVVTALHSLSKRLLAQHSQKVQRIRENDELDILWSPPILQVFNVLQELWLLKVLILSKDFDELNTRQDEQHNPISSMFESRSRTSDSQTIDTYNSDSWGLPDIARTPARPRTALGLRQQEHPNLFFRQVRHHRRHPSFFARQGREVEVLVRGHGSLLDPKSTR